MKLSKKNRERLAQIVDRHTRAGGDRMIVFDMERTPGVVAMEHAWHDIDFLLALIAKARS